MLYYRMSQARPFFRYSTLVVGVIVVLSGIVLTFLNIFQCNPISGAFDGDQEATCIDIISLYLCSAPVNVITDLAILVLPLPMVTSLRLDVRQKVGLLATFLTGVFVTVVDVVRIAYLQEALIQAINTDVNPTGSGKGAIPDFAWHASYSFMWSAVEVNVGLICACILVVKPLLALVVKVIPGTSQTTQPTEGEAVHPVASPHKEAGSLKLEVSHFEYSRDGNTARISNDPAVVPLPTTNAAAPPEADREMDLFEFFASADGLVDRPGERRPTAFSTAASANVLHQPSTHKTTGQTPPTALMDFVNLGRTKPLTELTRREAWWPVLFGEHMLRNKSRDAA
jgi:hypothetical protein